MTTHVIIPDPHIHPEFNNERMIWAAKFILDTKPDHVICIGDFADLPSMCSYDKGTKGFEGRRYKNDLLSVWKAQTLFFELIKSRKKKLPSFWMLEGNHEYRIKRAINADPTQLEGIISPNDLGYKDFGWNYIEYQGTTPGVLELDGIAYSHYFTSGVKGYPIGGEHPAYQLLAKRFRSAVQGHIHTTDYCVRTNAFNQHIHGLVCGCYLDYYADWAGNANHLWWRGLVVLYDVGNGRYDPAFISIDHLKEMYNDNV